MSVLKSHVCADGEVSYATSWWVYDAQHIPLARVCKKCQQPKLEMFRDPIRSGYTQADVNEPIDDDG